MIGNAHIDPVWLWPWQAGADEALATMASAADRCDEYPEFVFTRGEAWLYQQVERLRPDLFARIAQLIARGQWHVTGGQFIQPDLNLPTAAGLHRQIEPRPALFPRPLRHRPDRRLQRRQLRPYRQPARHPRPRTATPPTSFAARSSIRWRCRPTPSSGKAPAAAEVVAFRIVPGYVANFADLAGQVQIAVESADPALGHTMCFYGVGNHGGGPSKAMIEWILAHRDFDGHELVFSTPEAFFDAIAGQRDALPRVAVELQHYLPRLLQRDARHQVGAASRRGAAGAGGSRGAGARRRRRRRATPAWPGSTRPGTTCSSPSSTTS